MELPVTKGKPLTLTQKGNLNKKFWEELIAYLPLIQ
jgi:hypothetical protein